MSDIIKMSYDPNQEAFVPTSKAIQESMASANRMPNGQLTDTETFPLSTFDLNKRVIDTTDGPTTQEFKSIIEHSYGTSDDASGPTDQVTEYVGRHAGSPVEDDAADPTDIGRHVQYVTRVEIDEKQREAKTGESLVSRISSLMGALATRKSAASSVPSVSLRDRLTNESYAGKHRVTRAELRNHRNGTDTLSDVLPDDMADTTEENEVRVINIPVGFGAIEKIFAKAGRLYGAAEQKLGLGLTAGANALSRLTMMDRPEANTRSGSRERATFLKKKKIAMAIGGVASLAAAYLTVRGVVGDSAQHMASAADQMGNLPPLGEPTPISSLGADTLPPIGEPVPVDVAGPSAEQVQGAGFGESDYSPALSESAGNGAETPRMDVSDAFTGENGSTHLTEAGLASALDSLDGYEVAKGDSVWKLSERIASQRFGVKNPSVFQIDSIKDQLLPALKKAGAVNRNGMLTAGDIINIK